MAARENNVLQIKPTPPPTLNKELLGVWSAWSRMGDREVVREAVAKGLHVDWAHTFLAARKGLEPTRTKTWFKDEVYTWVSELLSRKQIFKASHIMSNINLDPVEEFTLIFLDTCDEGLRNYLGSHLVKLEQLEATHKEAWNLLQIIEEKYEFLIDFSETLTELNVKIVRNRSYDWKCNVGTELFFKTYDVAVKPFVTAEYAWKFLVKHNNVDLLKLWINIYFSQSVDFKFAHLNPQIFQHLTQMFLHFHISDNMINLVSDKNFCVSEETQRVILNELSKFGVFNETEQNNLENILARVADNENVDCLYQILNQETSTVDLFQFNELLVEYCVGNELYSVLNWCDVDFKLYSGLVQRCRSRYLDLMCYLRNHSDLGNTIDVGRNILRVSQFFSDDLKVYFNSNPLILISILMFLCRDTDLLALFTSNKTQINLENFTLTLEIVDGVLKALPFLNAVINRPTDQGITYQDLLKKHGNLNVDLFSFKLEGNSVPNFNSNSLVEKYGYKKTLSYIFYLKQARPSFAKKHLKEYKDIDKHLIMRKVRKLIAQNFLNKEITSACIAFLEMIGQSSQNLRIYIRAANVLHKSGNFTLGDVQNLLENEKNPEDFLNALEGVLRNDFSLTSDYTGVDLIDDVKKHEIAITFSRMHNLKLPELFLKHCAKNNLWLPFLLYIQIHNYPLNDVQNLLQHFQNPYLAEHLLHGLSHDIQVDDRKNVLMRDSRKSYLSRIGVRKSVDGSSNDTTQSSASSYGSHGSTGSSTGSSDFLESEHLDFKTDLLQTLIRCHNSIDPPKALLQACYVYKSPIFAVLSTSYEPDSIITNWLTWLSVSCEVEQEFSNFEGGTISADCITDLLRNTVKNGYGKALHESLQIFLPDNPLRLFVHFLNHCVGLTFDINFETELLVQFESELKQKKNSAIVIDVDYEMMYLSNKSWIETTASTLLATTLQYNFSSHYNQLRFLNFLNKVHIDKYFSIQVPDFLKFFDILNYLYQSKCDIKLDLSVIFNNEIIEKEVLSCIHELVSKKFYDCAFKIAKIHGICTDFIVISEWEDKFDKSGLEKDFWEKCNLRFESSEVQGAAATEFFEKCSEKTDDKTEKYKILNFAHKWASSHNLDNLYDVEKKMWMAYFSVDTRMADCDFAKVSHNMLYAEMKQKLQTLQNDVGTNTLNEEEIKHLSETIEKLLNIGDVWQAFRLAKIFDHQNNDVEVIVLCCSLSEGFVMPYQLSADQRMLLNKNGNLRTFSHRRRRTFKSSRGLSSISSASHSPVASTIVPLFDQVDAPFQDTLATLETLVERVKNGSKIVQNIFMTYRIAVNIEKSYEEVFKCTDPMSMLKEALSEDCSNKLEVVHDFCLLFKWSKEQIADLLCEELIISISDHLKSKLEPVMLWNLNLNADFHLMLQLLVENCSILGLKLYSYASALHKAQTHTTDFRISEISLVIELLIRSHDCFTTDCNMEGISTILRKCQAIISLLLTVKSWKLIVRLLTGVARYTEMNYVFHILRENDQFEFLLRKGSRIDNGLKVALLKYLRKYCPEERELYRMVALHFTLFSEIAQLWEEEARSIIRNLIAISKLEMQNNGLNVETQPYVLFTNTDGTKICLNKAMVNYTHATEYHLQGEKLAKAMSSAKQAELLALQISTLKGLATNSTTMCILNVSDAEISSLVSTELSFSQSLILIEAYNHKADWATVLFEQFVIHNHANYLENFLVSLALTDTLVNDISRKFLGLKAISDTNTRNMKEIVNKCASVRTKYRIASELGFSDLVEDLLAGNQLAFLKDTVWKKGYKS